MSRCMMGKLGDTALGFACVSLIFNIIAIALPYWFYSEKRFSWGLSIEYYGLWIRCNQSEIHDQTEPAVCDTFETAEGHLNMTAIRALEVTGLLLVAISVIIGFLKFVRKNPAILCLAGVLAFLAGFFIVLGTVVFGSKTRGVFEKGATLHVGFAFAVLSGVLAVLAGCMFVSGRSE